MSREVEKTFIERRVYDGAKVKRGYRVVSIRCVKDGPDARISELVNADTMDSYSAGCPLHRGSCFGHMCKTPGGSIMPPHSLAFRTGDIRTMYDKAASMAFAGKNKEYIDTLKRTNYGKTGHLRSIMSTPVSGSARLVCVSHDGDDPRKIYLSPTLASGIIFCAIQKSSDGTECSRYVERCLQEGDTVMLERPPSLSKYNNQPFTVSMWSHDCVGIHPKAFSYFHGDYDGDECHLYAIGNPKSLEECSKWICPLDKSLCASEKYIRDKYPEACESEYTDGSMESVCYSTLSFREIQEQRYLLPTGNYVRTKEPHLKMFAESMNHNKGTSYFLQDAMKGVRDIMRQQVSQGRIGDMSRVARLAAMCFIRGNEGGTYVCGRSSMEKLNDHTTACIGGAAVRCVMVLCQASQQAALDAHRVGSTESPGIDLISCLLNGRACTVSPDPTETLYVLSGTLHETEVRPYCRWCYAVNDSWIALASDTGAPAHWIEAITGAFSPMVLRMIPTSRRKQVCKVGVCVVYNYYSLRTEGDDIEDLVEAMCYSVEASEYPITTRHGILARNLNWIETVLACDYTKMREMDKAESMPSSASSATFCANFSLL